MDPEWEIELKLHVPADRLPDVVRDLGPTVTHHLEAVYFDTPDDRLASAGIAWRLRCDNGAWVQTLKAGGSDTLVRLEHEVSRPGPHRPALDPDLHRGSEAGRRLDDVLSAGTTLTERFRTDIERRLRVVHTAGSTIELALDVGVICAGDRTARVCELELELVEGEIGDLVATAQRWAASYGLWVDTVTKSSLGTTLASGCTTLRVTRHDDTVIDRHVASQPGDDAVARRVVAAFLGVIVPNVSAVIRGLGTDPHLDTAHDSMRRLGAVLAEWAAASPVIDPMWAGRIVDASDRLGTRAEGDHADFTALILDLLAFVHGRPGTDDDAHRAPV